MEFQCGREFLVRSCHKSFWEMAMDKASSTYECPIDDVDCSETLDELGDEGVRLRNGVRSRRCSTRGLETKDGDVIPRRGMHKLSLRNGPKGKS